MEIGNSPPRPRGARRGFTLVETLVALSLIIVAAMGPVTLASRAIFSAKFARSRLTALNLSQEGVEIVRHMRDNNLLAGFDWRGLTGGCAAGCARLQDGSYQIDVYTSPSGSTPPLSTGAPIRFDSAASLYNQSTGTPTPFTRMVALATPASDQMRITSTITWTESGISHQVELQEVLYNWIQP